MKNNNQKNRWGIRKGMKIFACQMEEHRNKDLETLGITGRQCDVLFFLLCNQDKKVKQVMIEQEFNLTNPTVTGILNRLESKELIVREAAENDKRCKYISLTAKAQLVQEEIMKKIERMEARLLEGVSEEELDQLTGILKKLTTNLSEMIALQEKE